MGNKKKGTLPGSEGFQRINFLHQASASVLRHCPNHPQLTAIYGTHVTSIGKKLQLKSDPSIKRVMCKSCKALLVPGQTAKVRIESLKKRGTGKSKIKKTKKKSVNEKFQTWTCLVCNAERRFRLQPGYKLWTESAQPA